MNVGECPVMTRLRSLYWESTGESTLRGNHSFSSLRRCQTKKSWVSSSDDVVNASDSLHPRDSLLSLRSTRSGPLHSNTLPSTASSNNQVSSFELFASSSNESTLRTLLFMQAVGMSGVLILSLLHTYIQFCQGQHSYEEGFSSLLRGSFNKELLQRCRRLWAFTHSFIQKCRLQIFFWYWNVPFFLTNLGYTKRRLLPAGFLLLSPLTFVRSLCSTLKVSASR